MYPKNRLLLIFHLVLIRPGILLEEVKNEVEKEEIDDTECLLLASFSTIILLKIVKDGYHIVEFINDNNLNFQFDMINVHQNE